MNAVGLLGSFISKGVYTVSGTFHPFGGAVDIVVVEQPDGSFKSSPWYVRFGKFQGVLKAKEKVVSVIVNGVEANFAMYLDHKGEAYFLREVDDEGESGLYPSSSGDEAEGKFLQELENKRILGSQSCNYDARSSIDGIEKSKDSEKIVMKTSSRQRILGFVWGRKSIKEDRLEDPPVARVDSLERAEIAADLLEVRWSTNLRKQKPEKSDPSKFSSIRTSDGKDEEKSKINDGNSIVASTVEGTMRNNLVKDYDTSNKQITICSQLALEDIELEVTREISSLNTKDQVVETSIVEEKAFDGTYEVKSTAIDIEQNAKDIAHGVGMISENVDSKSQISLSMNQDSSNGNGENFIGQCIFVETNTVPQVSDISEDKSESDAVRSSMFHDGNNLVAATVEGTMENNLDNDCDTCTKQITNHSQLALEDKELSIEVTREFSILNAKDQMVETSIIEEKAFDGTCEVKSTAIDIKQNAKDIVHAMGIISENVDSKSQISLPMNQDSPNGDGENFVGPYICVETNIVPQVSDISEDKSELDADRFLMFHDGNNLVTSTVEGTIGNNLDKDCDSSGKQITNHSPLALEDTKPSIEVTREISSLNTKDQVVETSIIEVKDFDGTYEVKSTTIDIEQNAKDIVHAVGIISENVDSKSQISLSMNQDSSNGNRENFVGQCICVETNTVPQVSNISKDKSELDAVRSSMFHDGNNLVALVIEGTMRNNLDKDCDTCNKKITNRSPLALEDTKPSIEITREISSLNTKDQVVETSIIEEKDFDGTYEVKSTTIDIEQNEKEIVHVVGIISKNVDSNSQNSLSMNQYSSNGNRENFVGQCICVEINTIPQVSDISEDKSELDAVQSSMFHDGNSLVASAVEGTMGNNLDKDCDTCRKQITNHSPLALEDTKLSIEVAREISSLNTNDQVVETSIIEEKDFDGTYEVKSAPIVIDQNAKDILHVVGIISENADSKSQFSLSMNQDSSNGNGENFMGQCVFVETNMLPQLSNISEDKSEPDAVRPSMFHETSKCSMMTLDDTVILAQRVPHMVNGGSEIVGVHTEGLHVTTEVHHEGTHSSVIAEDFEIETEKVDVLMNYSQQVDYCETAVYEGNTMDQGKPLTLAASYSQIVSTEEMVGSVKELKSDSIVSSFSSDFQDDKSVDGNVTNKFQNYLNSIGNIDMSKESHIMPLEISDDEQFLFGDFDVSKTEVNGNVESDNQHNNDKEEYPLEYSSSIDEEDRFVHRSYETCTSQDSDEIFNQGILSPMKIPQSHPISNIEVQRLAASLPNIHASIDYPIAHEVNHPLSHSMDLNTKSLKLIELCKCNSSCKSGGDGEEKAAEEQSKIEETCVSEELNSSLPNSTVGNPAEASVDPVGNWKLWPFSFRRSSYGKVTQSSVDSGKVTQSSVDSRKVTQSSVDSRKVTQLSVDSGKVTQSSVDSGKVTQSSVDSGKVTQSTVDDYTDFDMKMASNRNVGMDGEPGSLKHKAEKKMVRSISPTSEQLASLNLKEGGNTVTFTFYTAVWGQQQVDARIYLWKWNNRVVISDVDGTITKSDVLGQFMPFVGMDWSQTGVTNLFSAIKENGYQLLFLSARSISQAYHTRQFLFNLKQDGKALPEGPVVISPDGLFPSLYREVIRRAPHEFKIACLERIRELFPPDCNPFYAGFGNRDTDEFSYLKVGIPKGKIFIINPKGEVVVNRRVDTNSYTSLHSLVNGMFPPMTSSEQEDFNSWNYWKLPPSSVDF